MEGTTPSPEMNQTVCGDMHTVFWGCFIIDSHKTGKAATGHVCTDIKTTCSDISVTRLTMRRCGAEL